MGQLSKLYKHPKRNRWYVLDDWNWPLSSFDKPSLARKFRHLYKAYMTVNSDKDAESIMIKIKQLKGDNL